MRKNKILSVLLAVLLALSVLPVASMAEQIGYNAHESYMFGLLDQVWARLNAVEAEAIASGATSAEVTMAVYRAVINEPLVDENSITDLDDGGFFFRVNDMAAGYNYKARNVKYVPAVSEEVVEDAVAVGTKNGATNVGVLLVGPYYGYDSNFTNQYRNEAQTLADYCEGELVKLEGHAATGPAIAAAVVNAGVVIYDSHGTAGNGTSYLCLTTNSGITSTDLQNNWAYSSGSSDAGIDGRYIQNHIEGELPNNFFWMAICEGMKLSGHGVTGTALLAAGAGVVYGYSQSVTFAGDYVYEATFWNHMRQNETVAEAFSAMVTAHGVRDPYGDAYPIVMSADDSFPANPDSAQTVNSDWQLYRQSDLVVTDPENVYFLEDTVGVAPTFTYKLVPVIEPLGANNFTSTWETGDPNIAVVSKKGVITGVNPGTTYVTLTIESTEKSNTSYVFTASIPVVVSNAYLPEEVMYVPTDIIVPGETYLIGVTQSGRTIVMSNDYYSTANSRNLKATSVTLSTVDGVTCILAGVDEGHEWVFSSADGGSIRNVENGKYLSVSTNYLVMSDESINWTWTPVEGKTYGTMMNPVNANSKYLGVNTSNTFFSIFIQAANIQLYRKLTREAQPPMAGDVDGNGIVNANDALMIMRYSLGLIQLTDAQLAVSDVNGDGEVNANDALFLMRRALGIR